MKVTRETQLVLARSQTDSKYNNNATKETNMNCLVYRPQIMTNQIKAVGKWVISSLLFLIVSTVVHSAQSHDLGRAMKTHEAKCGTLLVRTNDQDQLRPVPMLATDLTINVTGIVSRSIVTQHFKNPTDQWLEGIYVFPLPDTAAATSHAVAS